MNAETAPVSALNEFVSIMRKLVKNRSHLNEIQEEDHERAERALAALTPFPSVLSAYFIKYGPSRGTNRRRYSVEINRGFWDGGDGCDTTVTLKDRVAGFRHHVVIGTDGSFSDGFPELGLGVSAGGWIEDFPDLSNPPYEYD
jgi:hypothetical protein